MNKQHTTEMVRNLFVGYCIFCLFDQGSPLSSNMLNDRNFKITLELRKIDKIREKNTKHLNWKTNITQS